MVRFTALTVVALFSPTLALWPAPRSLNEGTSTLRLANSFSISASFRIPSDLQDAITRTSQFLRFDNHAPLVIDRGASLLDTAGRAGQLGGLTLSLNRGSRVTSISEEAIKALGQRDESYALNVPGDGSPATLVANTTLGLFRGLATFSQLWYTVDGNVFLQNAPIAITDAPAFVSYFRCFLSWKLNTSTDEII